jgi:hypothetical protein
MAETKDDQKDRALLRSLQEKIGGGVRFPIVGSWGNPLTARHHLCTPAKDCSVYVTVLRNETGEATHWRLVFPFPHYEGVGAPQPVDETLPLKDVSKLILRVQEIRGQYTSM